jgi:hypothetical protein
MLEFAVNYVALESVCRKPLSAWTYRIESMSWVDNRAGRRGLDVRAGIGMPDLNML